MKKLIFGLIATFVLNSVSFAQVNNRQLKVCYTVSCCDLLIFEFDGWSQTTCYWVSNKVTIHFNSSKEHSKINVGEDLILAGIEDDKRNAIVLPKGDYDLVENNLTFTPSVFRPTINCIGGYYNG